MKTLLKVTGKYYKRQEDYYVFTYPCHVRAHIVAQKVNALAGWRADDFGRQVTVWRTK